jgi:outer membrane biosynthesis protein TonB
MFEKVTHGRAERRAFLHLDGVSASMAAHGVCAIGLALLSLAASPSTKESVETVTYLFLRTPEMPRETAPASSNTASGDARGPQRTATPPRPTRAPSPDAAADPARAPDRIAELALRTPAATVDVIPPPSRALDPALLRGLGDASTAPAGDAAASASDGASAGSSAGVTDDGGAAPLVESALLATPPEMLNRRAISSMMSEDYPPLLVDLGVQGNVLVAFVIGVDGRAEMDRVQVLSASHRDFVPVALRWLRRMRFRPAELDGRRVRVRVTLPLVWQLPRA